MDTDWAHRSGVTASVLSQCLRFAIQVVGRSSGAHVRAGDRFQGWKGRFDLQLHGYALSAQHHGPGMVHTFFGATFAPEILETTGNPHECWLPWGNVLPRQCLPYLPR